MNILFICGSLENGKDGVGDYTRRLAGECIRMGHTANIVGIMDKNVKFPKEEFQYDEDTQINTLRIPYNRKYQNNFCYAQSWISKHNPEWISFQYVPFSYHYKGLNFGLANCIKQISKNRKLHMMFHELWVWKRYHNDLKYWIWGWLQKYVINNFKKKLNPQTVHTQTHLYKIALERLGYSPKLLKLFSNIPIKLISNKTHKVVLSEIIKSKKKIVFVVFGEIQVNSPIESFCAEISNWGGINEVIIELKFIGKNGSNLKQWINVCGKYNIKTSTLGWQSNENITKELLNSQIGIVTTPYLVVEKSGSFATMSNCGLPIICVAKNWHPKGFVIQRKLSCFEYLVGNFETFIKEIESLEVEKINLNQIANQFISDILTN